MAHRSSANKQLHPRSKTRAQRRQLLVQSLERRELLAAGPRLISVNPNADAIFSPTQPNLLSVRPTELTFRFGGTADIDPATLDGIKITRAGGDGQFGDANDLEVQPGYVGFDGTNRIVVARFAEALPDDMYRVDIFGQDFPSVGQVALRDVSGNRFEPSNANLDRESLFFDLELGARVTGVVPQPVIGSGASRSQLTQEVHVYFDDPDLFNGPAGPHASLSDPRFYKLIRTADTLKPGDDTISLPATVTVNAALMRVELDFGVDLHLLPGTGSFRLRVGTDEQVAPTLQNINPGIEAGSVATAAIDLGSLAARTAMMVTGQSIVGTGLPMDYPGFNDEPGGRHIQDEDHLSGGIDTDPGIAQRTYTVRNGIQYGFNSAGQPVFSSINPEQQTRVREIFDFFGELFGMDFVEVDTLDMGAVDHVVVVGDLFPNGGTSGPGGVIGLAESPGKLAIMDGAENWDNSFGAGFFDTAMHEIGHLLGLGHSYDLPGGTVMGSTPFLPASGEWIFPGDHDIVHGQLLYRPDNRDVDMYRFEIGASEAGQVTIETIAERQANSSNLDTHITLFRLNAAGALEKVAANDDMFGNDSYLSLHLTAGTYFIGVTVQGNEDFDPLRDNTGSGGASQGVYDLRLEYRSANASSVLDTRGTAVDGDGDGTAGGTFNFWFKANDPAQTIYVDPSANVTVANGTLTTPFVTLKAALGAATAGSIIRLLPSYGIDGDLSSDDDNRAYAVGRIPSLNLELTDGANFIVPAGVTVMIEPGVIMKMLNSRILVGSGTGGIDANRGAIQVLGTPDTPVIFTSFNDAEFAINTNPLDDTPAPGDWGGIQIRRDVDVAQGRIDWEQEGIFLNYVAGADIRYGGGQVTINNQFQTVPPIDLFGVRPTVINNTITDSNAAAVSATLASFEETTFNEPTNQRFEQFVADYGRSGPLIYGNTVVDNTLNGLFVRVESDASGNLRQLEVPARFASTEMVHILGDNLIVRGNPGGSIVDAALPGMDLVAQTPLPGATGGTLPASTYQYRLSFVDARGYETVASPVVTNVTLTATGAVSFTGLPQASGDFVARRLYRAVAGGPFEYLTQLNRSQTTFVDLGNVTDGSVLALDIPVQRPRPDARLAIDPGIVIKSAGVRIETGFGADLIAEGDEGRPVIFTARADDRFGAGGTFNTNNTPAPSSGIPGSWGGIYAAPFGRVSIDQALIAYAGGIAGVAGGSVAFNPIELHQAHGRIAHTTFEFNASGVLAGHGTRSGLGPNEPAVIFVAGSQPVIVNNVFRDNVAANTAAISFDANALNSVPMEDFGRQSGLIDTIIHPPANVGPLVFGNAIARTAIGGLRVRGGTLTTESVWDDTDIVHVLQGTILVPDFHTYGGLRLQSRFNESLVAKFGANATLIADGRPVDIEDRIGGRLQILGAPGFPVIMTSLADDSVGAGFDPLGVPARDTNGDRNATSGAPGQWRGIQLREFSHDRNVATVTEREGRVAGGGDANGTPSRAQNLGELAPNEKAGDENLRLGFTIHGAIADPGDTDVYSFVGTGGTLVWIDIDRTGASLDSVLELVDGAGNVLARSNNSHVENGTGVLDFVNTTVFPSGTALPMPRDLFADRNSINNSYKDLYSTNPLDAAMRVVLPGAVGETETYFIRVSGAAGTVGNYQLQARLREVDEFGGSIVHYGSIHFAQIGIDSSGQPLHSLLTGEAGVNPAQPNVTVRLGNLLSSDRSAISAAGQLVSGSNPTNTFEFRVERNAIQASGNGLYSAVTIDVDYADGFGRPNTTLLLYRIEQTGARLVAVGSDSNVANDRAAPGTGADIRDLSRGSAGARDGFIGSIDLLAGDYRLVVTNNSQLDSQIHAQFFTPNPLNPFVRLEPVDSIQRVAEDRNFVGDVNPAPGTATAASAMQVAFSGRETAVEYALGDVTLFITGNGDSGNVSRLFMNNPQLGTQEAVIGNDFNRVVSVAMDPRGRLVGYAALPAGQNNDGNTGAFIILDDGVNYASFAQAGTSGLETFEATVDGNGNVVVDKPFGTGGARNGDGMVINALGFRIGGTTGDNRMYGVASRGNNEVQFQRVGIAPDNSLFLAGPGPARNVLYRLNPDTGAVINASADGQPRGGNDRARGAGTTGVEVGYLQTPTFDITGDVTGMTFIGQTLYGVTSTGQLFRTAGLPEINGNRNGTNFLLASTAVNDIVTINDPVTGAAVVFAGLTVGPNNADGGIHATTLFGISTTGFLYAIGTDGADYGELQPVFARGALRMATGVTGATDLDFSNLDTNLWHVTGIRGGDQGHGVPVTPTNTVNNAVTGGNSLYFGYSQNQAVNQAGTWTGGFDPSSRSANSYNFAGGAKGSIESYDIDLSAYSLEDKPVMYFNYFLNSETSSALLNAGAQMRDSLRVYGQGDDGVWRLLATNNLAGYDNNFSRPLGDNAADEFDVVHSRYVDANGDYQFVQQLFNEGEWRQARIPLAAFAGSSTVKIRMDFSTAGEPDRNVVEIRGVAGHLIDDGDTFAVTPPGGASVTFEFDHGLVLDVPSGAVIAEGDTIEIEGNLFTFSAIGGANVIQFAPNESAATIRGRIVALLNGLGIGPIVGSPDAASLINLPAATVNAVATGNVAAANMIVGQPGTIPGRTPVFVNIGMSASEVRDAVRTALALGMNLPGEETNEDLYPIANDSVRIFGGRITTAGPLLMTGSQDNATAAAPALPGIRSGVYLAANEPNFSGTALDRLRVAGTRGQANAFEGIYIDDIVIGFAERGELVTGFDEFTTPGTVANPEFQPIVPGPFGPIQLTEVTGGFYQVEIRSSAEYAIANPGARNVAFNTFDTNTVNGTQFLINVVGDGSTVRDGDSFTLSDGVKTIRFEFNNTAIAVGSPGAGVTSGSIAVPFRHSFNSSQLTAAIMNAINSAAVQSQMTVVAATPSGTAAGATTTNQLLLHGNVAVTAAGGTNFGLPNVMTAAVNGPGIIVPMGRTYMLTGDRNRVRQQGQVIIENSVIADSAQFGIVVSAGDRDRSGLGDIIGPLASTTLPRPGAPINFPTPNATNTAPGVVIANNILVGNVAGGINLLGDTAGGAIPVAFARVINNTIVGRDNGGTGVRVQGNASPTLVNNAVVAHAVGVEVSANGGNRVELLATLYAGNGMNTLGIAGLGAEPIVVGAGQPLFLDAARRNFIPAANSALIDSSIEFTADRLEISTLRQALGIRLSPIVAPARDLSGQLRQNDPSVGSGTGANVFIDRGALDRTDLVGPIARIMRPLDNDVAGRDIDLGETYIRLVDGTLNYFEIQLDDPYGTRPVSLNVTEDMVILTENGRRLLPGVDYVFGFGTTNNLIRLTPLSGIWKPGAAYEITLNNRDRLVLDVPTGDRIADGDEFTITDAAGTVARYVFDTGFVATIPATGVNEGDRVLYTTQNRTRRIEWLLEGSTRAPMPNTQIVIEFNLTDTPAMLAEKLAAGLRDLQQGLEGARAIEGNRVYIGGREGDSLAFEGTALAVLGTPGVPSGAFAVPIIPSTLLSKDVVAGQLVSAITRTRSQTSPALQTRAFTPGGGTVWLERTASVTGLSASAWTVVQTNGIRGLAGALLQSNRPSGETQFTILMPGVQLDFGDAPFGTTSVDNGARHVLGDNALPRLGYLVDSEENGGVSDENTPQLNVAVPSPALAEVLLDVARPPFATVVFGGTTFDPTVDVFTPSDGDTITISLPGRSVTFEFTSDLGIGGGNVGIPFDPTTVTRESLAADFVAAVNSQPWAIARASVDAADPARVELAAFDEDGVGVGPVQVAGSPVPVDGLFLDFAGNFVGFLNPQEGTAEIYVYATGSGLLDAWIDYDQNGDWLGVGEQVLTNALVLDGENRLRIAVPADAVEGMTALRVRLSTPGNQTPLGVAISGEVEDYQVRVVSVTPPVLVDDEYDVDEDNTLTVGAAAGVLTGAGADNFAGLSNVRAVVEDDPRFGTLTLNESDGSFVYVPADNFFGTDIFTYRIVAERDLVVGDPTSGILPIRSASVATVTVTVNPINDVPLAFDSGYITLEDDGTGADILVISPAQLLASARPGDFTGFPVVPDQPWDESAQTLRISALNVGGVALAPTGMGAQLLTGTTPQGSVVTASFNNGALVELMFQPTNNFNRQNPIDAANAADPALAPFLATLNPTDLFDWFEYTVSDNGRTVFPVGMGTIDSSGNFVGEITLPEMSITKTAFVRVDPVNDDPEFNFTAQHTVAEDSGLTTVVAAANLRPGPINALDEVGQVVTFALTPSSTNPTGLFSVAPTIDSNGVLRFQPAPNRVGTAVFSVAAVDNGPADGTIGDDPAADIVQLTITVTPVNDAPSFTGTPQVNVLEDTGAFVIPYATNILPGPVDAVDEAGQSLNFIVTPDPANPTGLLTGLPTIDANGVLRFNSVANAVGTARFMVRLRDSGGTANPGDIDTSSAQELLIHVRPVNDPPVPLVAQIQRNLLEDNVLLIPVSELLSSFAVGPSNEADGTPGGNQTLSILNFAPRRTVNGQAETVTDGLGNVTHIRYTPDPNYNSGATLAIGDQIAFTVVDNGTTYNLTQGALQANPRTVDFQVDLVIEPVNDRPSFSAATTSILRLEDVGSVTIPGWATNIVAAPASAGDETNPTTGQTVTFSVEPAAGQDPAAYASLFSVLPTVSPQGVLSYVSAPNAVGTARVQVVAVDSGDHDLGRGDNRFSIPVTLTLTLAPVNDPPIASPASVQYTLDEDRSFIIPLNNASGTGLYDIFRVGPANESSLTVPGGNQTFATDPSLYPTTTPGGGTLTPHLVGGNLAGLRYTPALDFNGTDSFTFGVRDNGRTYNIGLGTLINDFRESFANVTLVVNAVNDRPEFAGAVDVVVVEDVGSNNPAVLPGDVGRSNIADWVTNIQGGPATAVDEISGSTRQTVRFEVSYISGTPTGNLFAELPTVDPVSGQLRFRTLPNASGVTTFQVVAIDSGETGFLGNDPSRPEHLNQSLTRQFQITVSPINDPPSFTAGGPITVLEDSGPFNLLWATNISPGPADEVAAGQVVLFDVTISSSDEAKFLVRPTISDSGILRFTPADDANGQVIATVVARDTSGASLPGIPLTINITPVNDIPVGVDDQLGGNEDGLLSISAGSLLANDVDVDLPNDTLSVDQVAATSLLGATVTLSSDGQTISYDPRGAAAIQALRPGQTISDVFTYRARDLSGALTSPTNVTITLSGANDAPVAVNDLVSVALNQPTTFNPLANDFDVDGTLNASSVLITLQPAFGSLTINNAGQFIYTPSSSFTGTDFIRYVVRDDLGAVSNQASISIVVNEPPVANDDAVLTYRNETITFNPLANDSDPDGTVVAGSVNIINPPLRGIAIANQDGTITYQPNPDYFGEDSFTYQVRDNGGALSNVATVNLRVIASRLQNPRNALDVNDSGQVSPIDALLIINHLNRGGSVDISPLLPGPPFFDVDGNLRVTPTDALRVINFLNRTGGANGEGEGLFVGPAAAGRASTLGWSSAFASSHLVAEGEGFTPVIPARPATSSVWEWSADENRHSEWFDYLVFEEDENQEEAIDSIWSNFGNIE